MKPTEQERREAAVAILCAALSNSNMRYDRGAGVTMNNVEKVHLAVVMVNDLFAECERTAQPSGNPGQLTGDKRHELNRVIERQRRALAALHVRVPRIHAQCLKQVDEEMVKESIAAEDAAKGADNGN
jgi:hypothetical protein